MQSGLLFDIKRYSINDGPGIRVTVFLKGCPLHCLWCHNPESISTKVQKLYLADKCIGCNSCVEACPEKACSLTPDGIVTDQDLCTGCGICGDVCPTKATEMSGKTVTASELLAIIEKERIFFDQSGGGVTFSGGEPLLQARFLIACLDLLGSKSIHRTVDTTGFANKETLLEVAKRTDHFLYDLKTMNPEHHKQWTGVGNATILENLHSLAETGASIDIRIPLIKGINDGEENIKQTSIFISRLAGNVKQVHLLPYHNIMATKYRKLGQAFELDQLLEPGHEELLRIIESFRTFGIKATVGG